MWYDYLYVFLANLFRKNLWKFENKNDYLIYENKKTVSFFFSFPRANFG